MIEFREMRLGEIFDIEDGDRGVNYPKQNEFLDEGYCLFLNAGNVTQRGFLFSDNQFITIEKDQCLRKGKLRRNDIVVTTRGTVGNVAYYDSSVEYDNIRINSGMVILRNHKGVSNTRYLYQYLRSPIVQSLIKLYSSGSAQPQLPIKDLKRIKLSLPNLEVQNSIANALSAYDDLIENNNRRIALLENAAQGLYKEWFVRFRFPGYENTGLENGIPVGWEYVKLGDILSFERGISYSSEEIDCDEGLNLINLKNIDAFGGFRRDGTKKYNGKYKEKQVVVKGDLVIGVTDMTQDRRTVGAAALIPTIEGISVISADLVKVISDIPTIYLYSLCRYGFYSKYFSQFANGANVLHLKAGALLNKKLLLPTKDLIDSFVEKASAIFELIDKLNLANDNLIKQRDLLLPRLMSGKLEV